MTGQTLAPAATRPRVPDLIPARMINEFAYCPRLCYLEWVRAEWDDNEFTLDGARHHRRVDKPGGELPGPDDMDGDSPALHSRSVTLSDPAAGIIAKMDLIEAENGAVTPVDYKRGRPAPDGQPWLPERLQSAAQAMILRANGYRCETAEIYYVQTRRRVSVNIGEDTVREVRAAVEGIRALAEAQQPPPPLVDSPKCPGCSLAGICLPDETRLAADGGTGAPEDAIRRLYPARCDAEPLYVQSHAAYVGKSGERLSIKTRYPEQKLAEARLIDVSQVCLMGNAQISTQALHELLRRNVPVTFFTGGGWFLGLAHGMPHKNVELRARQFAEASSAESCLRLARAWVAGKIRNARTLLRRNAGEAAAAALEDLRQSADTAMRAKSLDTLLGVEGSAARAYYERFPLMLKTRNGDGGGFDFEGRNRRPPRDPVNALLSFAYSMLVKDLTITLTAVGFDPYMGFYHQPRYGRPALALDLMEPFRPLIADSTVINALNNGVVAPDDFIRTGGAVALKPEARKRFIQAYERRMDTLVTHPVFNYRLNYRRVLELECRLLARWLTGEITDLPVFYTR